MQVIPPLVHLCAPDASVQDRREGADGDTYPPREHHWWWHWWPGCGLRLATLDIKVTVLARNPELREIGAGLTLWTNGVHVLRQLGLADGHEQQTDLLVGADGLYSVIREQLLGKAPPRYSGYTRFSWGRLLRRCTCLRGHFQRDVGARSSLRHAADRKQAGVLVCHAQLPVGEQDREGERKVNLLRLFAGWREPIEQLIEATDEGAILRNDIFDRRPARSLGRGRVTLLCDAAHPPTPTLGQGACQALEDALALAGCLSDQRERVAALRAYEVRRMKRSAAIIKQSALVGKIGQWEQPLLCLLRDGLTPLEVCDVSPQTVCRKPKPPIVTVAERDPFSSLAADVGLSPLG